MNQSDLQNEIDRLVLRAKRAEDDAALLTTDNQTLKKALLRATRKADLADQLKSRFLANISHELRTPMNGILGMTELLYGTELDETQQNFTDSICRSTDSLLHIVNDILDFSSLEQGKIALEENVFFFEKMIKDVCAQYESRASSKNINLICNTTNCLQSPVIGDEFRVKQIICNLLDNAIKFTEEGEITVTQTTCVDSGTHSISVQDTGPGIETDVQKEIFKSFAQGDNSSTRRYGGTGLGLSIANAIAALMDGEITMESQLGKGTKFTLSCKLKAGNSKTISELGKNTLSGIKVLVVDDMETNREILELQLNQWDLDVHSADSGAQALTLLNEAHAEGAPFKIAILDLNMPEMDGLQLAEHIQKEEYSKDLRVMMLTSSTVELTKPAITERDILKVVMKPARQAMLYDAILHILAKKLSDKKSAYSTPSSRILLTEDDPINQEVATIMLESMGHEVVVADNGEIAVNTLLSDNNFDLVLMDCQMPVMDGFNATKNIRQSNPNIPIVALTANATPKDKDLCLDAGMDDYLTKPIHQSDLLRVVNQWTTKSTETEAKMSVENGKPTDEENTNINSEPETQETEKTMNIKIDESALDAIRSLQRPGKPDILARIVNMYVDKSPELISAIEEGVASNDKDKVKMAAHTLKSSSAYVGASELAEVCNRVEALASNDDLASTADDIALINSGYESVVSQIKQYG